MDLTPPLVFTSRSLPLVAPSDHHVFTLDTTTLLRPSLTDTDVDRHGRRGIAPSVCSSKEIPDYLPHGWLPLPLTTNDYRMLGQAARVPCQYTPEHQDMMMAVDIKLIRHDKESFS
ncbi:hypothetical protein JMJ77_0008066 [Colletotrichum scovillei]|uniref:Uncharacterized protein n=1 Tax=Colletotrichum scovillei TaxID=1209932 RepID=A0A9P7RE19_9PEZI|nr:hypothetical protein JMJ77_0008066 [Colletotrichum scovillei]KAG7075087.1 hypothetical protein JMJ76_0011550 [Colletotrichum scovillei]KAG7082121.1 hypothetical protein JMJ78_0004226 [Colletotrichum scovillei]